MPDFGTVDFGNRKNGFAVGRLAARRKTWHPIKGHLTVAGDYGGFFNLCLCEQ
jgi:hypothetical protein